MDFKTRLRVRRLTRAVYRSASERPEPQSRLARFLPTRWSAVFIVAALGVLAIIGLLRAGFTHTATSAEAVAAPQLDAEVVADDSGAQSAGQWQAAGEALEAAGRQEAEAEREVLVHVAGAVASPGVVRLRPEARAIDAIEAAGGNLPEADLDALNLAAYVSDGARIYVPAVGEAPAAAAASGGLSAQSACVDINAADATSLQTLDGIGPALASRIIAFRESSGPFDSVDDLDAVPGIGPALLERISAGTCQ